MLETIIVMSCVNICTSVGSYIHAYMIGVDEFYIRIGDVDDVFVASWVDDFAVVDGTVCI